MIPKIDWKRSFFYNFGTYAMNWVFVLIYLFTGMYALDQSKYALSVPSIWVLLIFIAVACFDRMLHIPFWTRTYYKNGEQK